MLDADSVKEIHKPPSVILKQLFSSYSGPLNLEDSLQCAAKECLLPVEEARIWCNHLQIVMDNRRRGTLKAAATRAAKRKAQSSNNCCGSCGHDYRQADEGQMWIFVICVNFGTVMNVKTVVFRRLQHICVLGVVNPNNPTVKCQSLCIVVVFHAL